MNENKKSCPKCKKVVIYKTKSSLNRSVRKKSICKRCLLLKEKTKGPFLKICCGCKTKSYYKNYNSYNSGKRNRKLCKKCSAKLRIPTMLGKHHTQKTKEKLSIINLGKHKGKNNAFYGRKHSIESKIKMRKSLIDRIKKKYRIQSLRFNELGCKYLDTLNKKKGWRLQHALNGGEFYVNQLGYYVDGYDKKRNIVVEYDESHHYYASNKLKEKDEKRMIEIKRIMNCRFFRYNVFTDKLKEY